MEQPEWDALEPQDAVDDLVRGGETVPERHETRGRSRLRRAVRDEPAARAVFREHGFEVAMEDERAIERPEQLTRERDGALEPVAKDLERRAKILCHDHGAARRTGMVARIRETRRRLEQHLELEKQLVLPVERERTEPRLALGALLARQAPRAAQEIVVRIPRRTRQRGAARRCCGHFGLKLYG